MEVWAGMTSVAGERANDPRIRVLMIKANLHGMRTEIDKQGRVMINKELRNRAELERDIIIEGKENYLILSAK